MDQNLIQEECAACLTACLNIEDLIDFLNSSILSYDNHDSIRFRRQKKNCTELDSLNLAIKELESSIKELEICINKMNDEQMTLKGPVTSSFEVDKLNLNRIDTLESSSSDDEEIVNFFSQEEGFLTRSDKLNDLTIDEDATNSSLMRQKTVRFSDAVLDLESNTLIQSKNSADCLKLPKRKSRDLTNIFNNANIVEKNFHTIQMPKDVKVTAVASFLKNHAFNNGDHLRKRSWFELKYMLQKTFGFPTTQSSSTENKLVLPETKNISILYIKCSRDNEIFNDNS